VRGCVHVDFDPNQVVVLQLIVEDFAFVLDASDMDTAGLVLINKVEFDKGPALDIP
jgi:hypothetical protein